MASDLISAVVLGIIEGLTEFLPISSTGHLVVAERLLGFSDPGEVFAVVIQLGAILAVCVYFHAKLWRLTCGVVARDPAAQLASTRERIASEDPGAVVGQLGVNGEDPVCARAVDLFCGLYGAEAGNLALKTLPFGGVFLAGGVTLHLLSRLRSGFMPGFLAKGRMSSVLARMPVAVVLDAQVGLRGAALAATALISRV